MTTKFALVIANTDYQDESLAKLTAPGRDAQEFARVLEQPELAGFEDVQVLLNETEAKTRRAIARFFAERKPADLLLLYFSGHGVRNEQGQLFLAANDTEISILEATGVPSEFITRSMNNSRSQRQLLILDCCNSGAFAQGAKSASALGKSMGMAEAFEGNGFGRIVLTATDATQFAWEGDKVIGGTQNSVFTHFLIEGLKGEADRDGDGKITVDELYDYAYEQVVRRTPKQTPGKWSYKQQGEIILRDNLKPREVKPAPLPSDLLELLSYPNFSARKAGIQELVILLDGKHLGLKRAAEEKLREIASNDNSLDLCKTASDILIEHGLSLGQIANLPDEDEQAKLENAKREAAEKAAREKAERERMERELAKERDFAQKEAREKAEREALPPLPAGEGRGDALSGEAVSKREGKTAPIEVKDSKPAKPKIPIAWGVGILILVVISLCSWGVYELAPRQPTPAPSYLTDFAQQTAAAFVGEMPTSAETKIPPTHTLASPTITLTPDISTFISDGVTMLYVPEGIFSMGSEKSSDEKPIHPVDLDAYYIDKYEVTNAAYKRCVDAGVCDRPKQSSSYTRSAYYGNSEFDEYPVIYVDWNMANKYCSWRDARLPTEAEWEKAARGTDGRTYPWGENIDSTFANYDQNVGDTTAVGSYASGQSPYGVYDMAGNVWEWVNDWYQSDYYATLGDTVSNPQGPSSGDARVLRGGSWGVNYSNTRSAYRLRYDPTYSYGYFGFRCSRSP